MDKTHSELTKAGQARAALFGRRPGGPRKVSDDAIRAVIHMPAAKAAAAVGLTRAQLIRRRRLNEEGTTQHPIQPAASDAPQQPIQVKPSAPIVIPAQVTTDPARDLVHRTFGRTPCNCPSCIIDVQCEHAISTAERRQPDLAPEIQHRTNEGWI